METLIEIITAQLKGKGEPCFERILWPSTLSLARHVDDNPRSLGFELFCLEEQHGALRALYAATFPEAEETFTGYQEVRNGSRLLQEWSEEFRLRYCSGMPSPPVPAYTRLVDLSINHVPFDRAADAAHAFHTIFNEKMQAQAASGRAEYPPAS